MDGHSQTSDGSADSATGAPAPSTPSARQPDTAAMMSTTVKLKAEGGAATGDQTPKDASKEGSISRAAKKKDDEQLVKIEELHELERSLGSTAAATRMTSFDDGPLFASVGWQRLWSYLIGASALFELSSFTLPFLLLRNGNNGIDNESEQTGGELRPPPFLFFLPKRETMETVEEEAEGAAWEVIRWLDGHRRTIGIVFSVLWVVHAFVSASRFNQRSVRRREKKLLLEGGGGNGDAAVAAAAQTKTGQPKAEIQNGKGNKNEGDAKSGGISIRNRLFDRVHDRLGWGPTGVYYAALLWQLSLLPVGFFFLSLVDLRDIFDAILSLMVVILG